MILEYIRPKTLDEALKLLARSNPFTVPLGGGTVLSRHSDRDCAVVDLQNLGLDQIESQGNQIRLGSMVTLEHVANSSLVVRDLRRIAQQETSANLRRVGTLGGTITVGTGESRILTCFLALDAELTIEPGNRTICLGDWLPLRAQSPHSLIVSISIPANVRLGYESVSRTPSDLPLVGVAIARWPSGRTRVVIGAGKRTPALVLDGPEPGGIETAIINADRNFASQFFSIEYLQDVVKKLANRIMHEEIQE